MVLEFVALPVHKCYAEEAFGMGQLTGTGIAIDSDLLARFLTKQDYANRSEAFRGLIRDLLVWAAIAAPEGDVVGTITLVYDHHSRLLPDKLMNMQHNITKLLRSSTKRILQ